MCECSGNNIVLPQGPTGPAGPAGPAGANGSNGTNGTNGSNGVFKYIQQFRTTFGQSNPVLIAEASIPFGSFSNANVTNTFSDFIVNFWFSSDGGSTWTQRYVGASDGYIQFCTMSITGLSITTGNIPTGVLRVVIMA